MSNEPVSDPYLAKRRANEQFLADEEAFFEVWFQLERQRTFKLSSMPGEKLEDHPNWSMGTRTDMWRGWLARAGMHVTYARSGEVKS